MRLFTADHRRSGDLFVACCITLLMVIWLVPSAAKDHGKPALKDPLMDKVAFFEDDDLVESSGLAASNRKKDRFWTHNDSGGKPRLFAVNTKGETTGECRISNAEAKDWEDMASFVQDKVPRLIVGDSGDNLSKRKSISLLIFDEPSPEKSTKIKSFQELIVTFSDGPQDCEAIAVDTVRGQIFLVAKTKLMPAGVYVLPLPERADNKSAGKSKIKLQAERVGSLLISMVSAMDLEPESGDIYLTNYLNAYHFPCGAKRERSLHDQIKKMPEPMSLPQWKQIEAIAIDAKKRVWLSSEGSPAPIGRMKSK